MNYRHAYHAGNFADCLKHAVLVAILRAMLAKPTPFRVLDTHAGLGFYDLHGTEAEKTGEWRGGIGRLLDDPPDALADWLGLVREAGGYEAGARGHNMGIPAAYPGSPALVARLLRPTDRLVANELHPEDHAALASRFASDRRVQVTRRDAADAVRASTPFPEGRGLVLVDPPFEAPDEFDRCLDLLDALRSRFGHGAVALWYPIKHRAPVRAFRDAVRARAWAEPLAIELLLREPVDPTRLNGCAMLLLNLPWSARASVETAACAVAGRVGAWEEPKLLAV